MSVRGRWNGNGLVRKGGAGRVNVLSCLLRYDICTRRNGKGVLIKLKLLVCCRHVSVGNRRSYVKHQHGNRKFIIIILKGKHQCHAMLIKEYTANHHPSSCSKRFVSSRFFH